MIRNAWSARKSWALCCAGIMAAASGVLFASPAMAVIPGSVSPYINTTAGSGSFTLGNVSAGWATGTIHVSVTAYISSSSAGPWVQIAYLDHYCYNTGHCSTPGLDGYCADAWYKAAGSATGPGGRAENNGRSVIKHVSGGISGAMPAYSSQCKELQEEI